MGPPHDPGSTKGYEALARLCYSEHYMPHAQRAPPQPPLNIQGAHMPCPLGDPHSVLWDLLLHERLVDRGPRPLPDIDEETRERGRRIREVEVSDWMPPGPSHRGREDAPGPSGLRNANDYGIECPQIQPGPSGLQNGNDYGSEWPQPQPGPSGLQNGNDYGNEWPRIQPGPSGLQNANDDDIEWLPPPPRQPNFFSLLVPANTYLGSGRFVPPAVPLLPVNPQMPGALPVQVPALPVPTLPVPALPVPFGHNASVLDHYPMMPQLVRHNNAFMPTYTVPPRATSDSALTPPALMPSQTAGSRDEPKLTSEDFSCDRLVQYAVGFAQQQFAATTAQLEAQPAGGSSRIVQPESNMQSIWNFYGRQILPTVSNSTEQNAEVKKEPEETAEKPEEQAPSVETVQAPRAEEPRDRRVQRAEETRARRARRAEEERALRVRRAQERKMKMEQKKAEKRQQKPPRKCNQEWKRMGPKPLQAGCSATSSGLSPLFSVMEVLPIGMPSVSFQPAVRVEHEQVAHHSATPIQMELNSSYEREANSGIRRPIPIRPPAANMNNAQEQRARSEETDPPRQRTQTVSYSEEEASESRRALKRKMEEEKDVEPKKR